nr:hypothetical protein [Armatimonas sp.]
MNFILIPFRYALAGMVGLTAVTVGYHVLIAPEMLNDGQYAMFLFPTASWGGFWFGMAFALMRPWRSSDFARSRAIGILGSSVGLAFVFLFCLLNFRSSIDFSAPTLVTALALILYSCNRPWKS